MIQRVLVIGSGQLGLMMAEAGSRLGIVVDRLDPEQETLLPGTSDRRYEVRLDDLLSRYPVITAEREHLPDTPWMSALLSSPEFHALSAYRQLPDRLSQKSLLDELRVPTSAWMPWPGADQAADVLARLGQGARIKRRCGGYDGRGQWRLDTSADAPQLGPEEAIVESHVSFRRELSLVGGRSVAGEKVFYPLVENVHHEGILRLTVAPARDAQHWQARAESWLGLIMDRLDYTGVMAMELFDTGDELLVNELAPRVHNSGHWSQTGASLSQFDLHLRCVTGLPLLRPEVHGVAAMANIIGEPWSAGWYRMPGVQVYWYGKEVRPGRKLGHLNICAPDLAGLAERVMALPPALLCGIDLTVLGGCPGDRATATLNRKSP